MNISTLKDDVNFLCGSTSASYPDSDKIRNINVAYHTVATLIWESDGTWNYDDANNTDTPKATRTLGNASATYIVPTTALRIEGVEIKDNQGNWSRLKPISYHDIDGSPEEYYDTPGLPIQYQLEGNEIRLFPAPASGSVTLSSGMMVRLSRAVTEFATSASTTTPGFAAPFHRILSYAATLDFLTDPNDRNWVAAQKQRLEQGLIRFYSKRGEDFKTRILPAGKKRWRQYR